MSRMEHDVTALRTGGLSLRVASLLGILCVAQACGTALEPSRSDGKEEAPKAAQQAVHQPGWHAYPSSAREGHAAVALSRGRALVCGGSSNPPFASVRTCEILSVDDSLGLVTEPFASLPEDRIQPTLSLLTGGRVVIAGGRDAGGTGVPTARVGTLAGGWGEPELLSVGRGLHTASVLEDSVVLIGGQTGTSIVSPIEARSSDGSWSVVAEQPRSAHTATVLRSGAEVLVTGGYANGAYLRSAAVFSVTAGWREVASLPAPRINHTATLLEDGSVLVAGGSNAEGLVREALLFDGNTWRAAGSTQPRHFHSAASIGRYVVVAGGISAADPKLASVEVFDALTEVWTSLSPLRQARSHFHLLALGDGLLVASGGAGDTGTLGTSEVFAPALLGEPTDDPSTCIAGYVADGVCCESACEGQCESCVEPGFEGSCRPVDGPPREQRAECEAGFVCQAGACAARCEDDTQCVAGYFCERGACEARRELGKACSLDRACVSGQCVDGFCCESACEGQCETCALKDFEGQCAAVPKGELPRGERPDCPGGDLDCEATCDGTKRDECSFVRAGEECGEAECAETGELIAAPRCDGRGVCEQAAPVACEYGCDARSETESATCAPAPGCMESACNQVGYRCDGATNQCKQRCDKSETDCAGGYYCHPLRNACVEAVPFPAAELPSCSMPGAPARPTPTGAWFALLVTIAGLRRRSQRQR